MSQEQKTFPAHATHPTLGDAEVAGTLAVGEFALRFASESGAMELPYDGLDIAFGTKQDRRITFTHEQVADGVFIADNADLLCEPVFRKKNCLRRQIDEHREQLEGRRRLVLTGLFFGAFVGLSAVLGAAVEWGLPRLISRVPVKFEKHLGDEAAAAVLHQFKPARETNVTAQLEALVTRLTQSLPQNDFQFRVTVLADALPNAFALPGGNIFVNVGLLRLCTNSVEVAGVLAHEIAHVTRRHGLRTMITTIGPARAMKAVLGDNHGFLSTLAAGSDLLIGQSFSREFEREADEGGFDLMVAANFDPRGLEQGLRRLDSIGGGDDGPRALMSHPPTSERLERLAARWNSAAKKTDYEVPAPLPLPTTTGNALTDRLDRLLNQ